MAKKNTPQSIVPGKRIAPVSLERILLTLSLVPLVGGVLLIVAWSLDFTLVGTLEAQIYVGLLMILISFSLSNFVQRRWLLGAGWLLLVVSDWLLLTRLELPIQGIAIIVGVIGVALLLFEFVRQLRKQKQNSA